ncbi:hypothetical protein K501DRAFT_329824 [Backusella circina FSU 941]|nr:hypothetical protein K501DRAFT_329824 [Backusella circina FSU 941]
MSSESNRAQMLKQLVDGVQVSKEIITTAMLMYKPEGIVPKIEANYKKLNDLFKNHLDDNGFLNMTNTAAQIEAFKPHIFTMVYIINIALATFKLFSATQLDGVLKSLFTAIVPVNTDIQQHIVMAYSELLHREAINKKADCLNLSSLIRSIRSTRPNHIAVYDPQLDRCEEECIVNLENGMSPMSQGDFIMLWERAFNSMVRQSREIRNMLLAVPKEIVEASLSTKFNVKSGNAKLNNNNQHAMMSEEEEDQSEIVGSAQEYIESGKDAMIVQEEDQDDGDDDVFTHANEELIDMEAEQIEEESDDNSANTETEMLVLQDEQNANNDNGGKDKDDEDDSSNIASEQLTNAEIKQMKDAANISAEEKLDNNSADYKNEAGVAPGEQNDNIDEDDDSDDIFFDARESLDDPEEQDENITDYIPTETQIPSTEQSLSYPSDTLIPPTVASMKRNSEDSIEVDEENALSPKKRKVDVSINKEDDIPSQENNVPVAQAEYIPTPNTQQSYISSLVKGSIDDTAESDENQNQTPPPPSHSSSSTISQSSYPKTVEEFMASNVSNPYICKKSRFRTSLLDAGSYTRRRRAKGL